MARRTAARKSAPAGAGLRKSAPLGGSSKWQAAVAQAKKELGVTGVARRGTRLYARAKQIYAGAPSAPAPPPGKAAHKRALPAARPARLRDKDVNVRIFSAPELAKVDPRKKALSKTPMFGKGKALRKIKFSLSSVVANQGFPQMSDAEFNKKYAVGKALGSGSYGVVYRGVEKSSGDVVAIKKLHDLPEDVLAETANEIAIMSRLSHPALVKFYAAVELPKSLAIVMEFLGGGDLAGFKIPNKRTAAEFEPLFWGAARDLWGGLAFLHAQGVAHRDIKPANILVRAPAGKGQPPHFLLGDYDNVCLADLKHLHIMRGTAPNNPVLRKFRVKNDVCDGTAGTNFYMAPEINKALRKDKRRASPPANVWVRADVWCLTLSLLEAFFVDVPENQANAWKLKESPQSAADAFVHKYTHGAKIRDHAGLQQFFTSGLQIEPKKRPAAAEFEKIAKQHARN